MKAESSTPHFAMTDSSIWPRLKSKALSKAAESAKSSGCKKCSSAHSSCRLFCSGVPVSSSLRCALMRRSRS